MTYVLSRSDRATCFAFNEGWRVSADGTCYRPDGARQTTHITRGYKRFVVYHIDRYWPVKVHRLAAVQRFGDAALFVDGVCVRHLDNDKTNNSERNLALGSGRDNHEDNPRAVNEVRVNAAREVGCCFDDETARSIVRRVAGGETQTEVARSLGVSPSTIHLICAGKTYASATGIRYSAVKRNVVSRKLSAVQARLIVIEYYTTRASQSALGRSYGVSPNIVGQILRGKAYSLDTAEVRATFEAAEKEASVA